MPGSLLPTGDDARVLVVDGDPAMRQAVCELLRMAGLLVVAEAGGAPEGLGLVDRAAPRVVVVALLRRAAAAVAADDPDALRGAVTSPRWI